MKIKVISLIVFTTMLVGCQKQPEQVHESVKVQFEEADQKISDFLDLLDDPDADKDKQKEVLCVEYPKVYKQEYMPTILKLTLDVTKENLLKDFNLLLITTKKSLRLFVVEEKTDKFW
ncbi:MAG: hypothetical protein WBG77_02510 [Acinetobacter venetianus]|uniref:hypothetical protein n=1 Tax=Acinetobacter venetianus TaxID=52133 RepID=UPI0035BE7D79